MMVLVCTTWEGHHTLALVRGIIMEPIVRVSQYFCCNKQRCKSGGEGGGDLSPFFRNSDKEGTNVPS